MTAAAIELSSSVPPPKLRSTEFTLAARMMPPIAAIELEIMNTRMRIRGTLMPARRAASAFPPTA